MTLPNKSNEVLQELKSIKNFVNEDLPIVLFYSDKSMRRNICIDRNPDIQIVQSSTSSITHPEDTVRTVWSLKLGRRFNLNKIEKNDESKRLTLYKMIDVFTEFFEKYKYTTSDLLFDKERSYINRIAIDFDKNKPILYICICTTEFDIYTDNAEVKGIITKVNRRI